MIQSSTLFSTAGIKLNPDRPINSRARLFTGRLCDKKCEFCYYKDNLLQRDSLVEILKRVDDIKQYGISEIELSGGESSIEPNWFSMLEYIQTKNFSNVSTLSSGGKFVDINFVKQSKQLGLTEILFSLHGPTADIHDTITGKPGSFNKLLLAIQNSQAEGLTVRINTTVYDKNYSTLPHEYSVLIKQIKPSQVNFISMNYTIENAGFTRIQDLELISTNIKQAIDIIKSDVSNITVRYIPFCYMIGYEKYVYNFYQHIHDMTDWNLPMFNHTLDTSISYSESDKRKHALLRAKELRLTTYVKKSECKDCCNFFICDGVSKQCHDWLQVKPITGPKITQVDFYQN